MEFSKLACIASVLLPLAATSPVPALPQSSLPAYDVLIVGGGPAGLSAASALGRVNRSALLIDSGVYRKIGPVSHRINEEDTHITIHR